MFGVTVVVGDVNDDLVVRPLGPFAPDSDTPSSIRRAPGGSAANQAVWLAKLGVPVRLVARVGAVDRARLTATFGGLGVDARLGADANNPTGAVVVVVGAAGTRAMYTDRGANAHLDAGDLPSQVLDGAGHLHLSGYALASTPARLPLAALVSAAVARGTRVTLDPASEAELDAWPGGPMDLLTPVTSAGPASVILPNLAEGRALTGLDEPSAVARALLDLADVVALKLGDAGLVVADRTGEVIALPARPGGAIVDPTGAGDALAAGFLASWRGAASIFECATAGLEMAGRAVRQIGAQPGPSQ